MSTATIQCKKVSRPERLAHWLFTTCGSWRNVMAFGLIAALTYISIRFNYELGKMNGVDAISKELLPIGYALLDLAGLFLSGYIGIRTVSLLRRWISWGWFSFLLALSLWAAASFTLSVDSRLENAELNAEITSKKQAVETQSQKVDIWKGNLSQTKKYKTRYSGILTQEQNKHAELVQELAALEAKNTAPALAIYERVSPHLGLSTTVLLTIVKLAWATALTLSPIILMMLVAAEFGLVKKARHHTPLDDSPTEPPKGNRRNKRIRHRLSNLSTTLRQFSPYRTQTTIAPSAQQNAPEQVQLKKSNNSTAAPERVHSKPHETVSPEEGAPVQMHLKPKTQSARTLNRAHPRTPSDQRDAGTTGKAGHRYQDLKQRLISHPNFKPSQRSIREYCRCNQEVATRYQQQLEREGVIERQDNGYYRVVQIKAKLHGVQ